MKMTAADQGDDASTESRLVDKAMYIGGFSASQGQGGKSWLEFDLSDLSAGATAG